MALAHLGDPYRTAIQAVLEIAFGVRLALPYANQLTTAPMLLAPPQNLQGGLAHRVKHVALSVLTTSLMSSLLRPLTRGHSIVFTLHRFEDPEHGISGHPEKSLRAQLELLRRERHLVLPLHELVQRLHEGSLRGRSAIAFTVDDGYGDFARVGAGVFAAFDCPVTVFLPTSFLDGKEWLWWDRIEASVGATENRWLTVEIRDQLLNYGLDSSVSRTTASLDLTARLKRVPNEIRLSCVEQIVAKCGVSMPATPPAKYAPMSWDDVRALSAAGVSFGPHTVTHPILPMVDDAQAVYELEASWRRVSEAAPNAIPVFSYPNGDYSGREQAILARMGLAAAVSNRPQYLHTQHMASADSRYALSRFCLQDDQPHFVQIVSGLERAKENLRRPFRRSTKYSRVPTAS